MSNAAATFTARDASAPAAMRASRRFEPARTGWIMLIPLDAKARVNRVRSVDGVAVRDVAEETYAAEYLATAAANRKAQIAANGSLGVATAPWPVSRNHSFARKRYFAEDLRDDEVKIDGSDLDLHFHPGGDDIPAGLYSLVEWADSGYYGISAGEILSFSATTAENWTGSDGTVYPGPSVVEIGTVHAGAVETAGGSRNQLGWDAFGETVTDARPTRATIQFRDAAPAASAATDGATLRAPTEASDTYAIEMAADADPTTSCAAPDAIPADSVGSASDTPPDGVTMEDMAAFMKEIRDGLAGVRADVAALKALEKAEDVAEMAEVAVPTALAPEADATVDEGAMMARAAVVERKLHSDVILRHVAEGSLLSKDVPAARKLLADGKPIADLLCDLTALSSRSGVAAAPPAGATGSAPKSTETMQQASMRLAAEGVKLYPANPVARANHVTTGLAALNK